MSDEIDNLRRELAAERTAREEAERALQRSRAAAAVDKRRSQLEARRIRANEHLARASASLSASLDLEATLRAVIDTVLPTLGDFGFLDVVEDGADGVRRVPMAYRDPARQALLESTSWVRSTRTDINLCALSTGQSGLHSHIGEDWLVDVAETPEHLALMRQLAFRSMLTVPLALRGRILGALTLFYGDSGRRHDEEDVRVAEDVASRAALAIDNARLYRAAREADRRKDEFLAMLGHELRNPLAPIATAVELMKITGAEIHARERVIIERQVGHLVRLVDDLLDVSRITRGKIELDRRAVEAATVVAKAVEQSSPLLERYQHRFVQDVQATGLLIDVDEHRLAQVLSNLLNNAAKYTPPGGLVELTAAHEGDHVVFRVRDSGRGIAQSLLPHVFDLFAQGDRPIDRQEGGLGLGLSIARSLVELHGGTIQADSEGPGCGSTFTVRLAPAAEDARPRTPVRLDDGPRPAAVLRVLVVDDNPDAAQMLAEAVRADGHTAEVAHDGPTALQMVERFQPDVALLDIGLPVMDGYELANTLRTSLHPKLRLVAVTGYGQERDIQRSLEAGFEAHLVKPIQLSRLRAALQRPE